MTSLISLRIWLGLSLISAYESPPVQQPQQTVRVFADVEHTGILTGPLTSTSPGPNEFGIAVPLSSGTAGRDRWPERLDADDPVVERLGRLRVETTQAAGDVVVSIESDSRRCLRLFRKGSGGWRQQAPGEDHSWTLAPGKDGSVEVGVGVMIPEAKGCRGSGGLAAGVHRRDLDEVTRQARGCACRSAWRPSSYPRHSSRSTSC